LFNLLPGHGLGFSASRELAFGLGPVSVSEFPVLPPVLPPGGGGSIGPQQRYPKMMLNVFDNAYSSRHDDDEIIEILSILFEVIE